ncbi:MAG: alpha-glucosidase [Candidatus Cloacimonetes bacterium]|nr:alpha-glucosidase [Candidatus Cloacimonadota bacterium]
MKSYRFGNPFSTGAVIEKPVKFLQIDELPGFKLTKSSASVILRYRMQKDDIVIGLGEQLGGINKRGRKYITYNTDIPEHTPDKLSLYGSHPFIIIQGRYNEGLFIDYPGEISFDVGFSDKDILEITVGSADFDLYHWQDNRWQDIVTSYLELTGGVYVPPKWAFGYQQCRWSYPEAKSVEEVANKFRQLGIPCDAIYLDIDYMQDYKVFTVNEERFPDFGRFVKELRDKGFHLIPIIDPGVKIESDYPVYEEGKKHKYFCTDEQGEDFQAAVWPGLTHLPDFSNAATRNWWGNLYKKFIELGIEGFWNDMNEPAIFYTNYQQQGVYDKLQAAADNKALDKVDLIGLQWQIRNFHNSREDYQSIYQHPERDKTVCHDQIHNLYGAQMAQSFSESVQQSYPDKRFLIFSRSSYSGSQRFGGIWYGDNKSWWEHLELNIKMLINCNLVGYFYSGADIGGFGDNCQAELLIRWLQLGVFSPLFRNHSAIHTRRQELWEFDKATMNQARKIIRLRYALLPWLYSQFLEFASMNIPLIQSLSWSFSEPRCREIEDQLIYGGSLMIAPVYKPNVSGRMVYLPQDKWLLWWAGSWEDRKMKVLAAGDHFIECPLDRQLIFIKENTLITMQEPEDYVDQRKPDTLFIIGLVSSTAQVKVLVDQGKYPAFAGMAVLDITMVKQEKNYEIEIKTVNRELLQWQQLVFELYNDQGNLTILHRKLI